MGGRVGLRAANSESEVMSAAMQSPTPALTGRLLPPSLPLPPLWSSFRRGMMALEIKLPRYVWPTIAKQKDGIVTNYGKE